MWELAELTLAAIYLPAPLTQPQQRLHQRGAEHFGLPQPRAEARGTRDRTREILAAHKLACPAEDVDWEYGTAPNPVPWL